MTVHPRVGGEHAFDFRDDLHRVGSSPRGRGTHRRRRICRTWCRFIPAWAGNTAVCRIQSILGPVHPRVGGEHLDGIDSTTFGTGSSPRGRGTHHVVGDDAHRVRFIPAWAGNTSLWAWALATASVHPRVGGEHILLRSPKGWYTGSSPRGRGTRVQRLVAHARFRFIPAWAGNTLLLLLIQV